MAHCWLKKRKDRGGTYYLFFSRKLGLKPISLNTTEKSFALEVMRRKESEIFCGEHGIRRKNTERIRYSDLLRRFIKHKTAAGVKEKTLTNYLKTLNHFGTFNKTDLLIDAITTEQLESFISARRNTPARHDPEKKLAPKTIRDEVFILINLFSWAVDRDLLIANPMRRVTKPRRVKYDAPRALTYDEYLRLKAVIKNEKFSEIVDFYVLTGIRRSDGPNITSDNFDFNQMVVTLPQEKQSNNKSIPISADLADVVKRMIQRVGTGKPLVQLHPSRLTGNFQAARKKAGLPESITFHSLRHSFASWLAALGTDFKTLQSLTGHASSEAAQLYVHAFDPNRRSAIDKLKLPRKTG